MTLASAFQRFRDKCEFDPRTGCVRWIGGRTRGRGNTAEYGSFWFEGRRWYAHRWAARYIHGLAIDGLQVGHCCPNTADGHPDTLCVEHVRAETQHENLTEQRLRGSGVCAMTAAERRAWLLVERGYDEPPPVHDPTSVPINDIPFFTAPGWLSRPGA